MCSWPVSKQFPLSSLFYFDLTFTEAGKSLRNKSFFRMAALIWQFSQTLKQSDQNGHKCLMQQQIIKLFNLLYVKAPQ